MARVRGKRDPNPTIIVAHRPESDAWPERKDVNNPDWRYSLEYRDLRTGDLVVKARITETEANTTLLANGYASSGLVSRLSNARMKARDPENKRGASRISYRSSLERRTFANRRISLWVWCVEHHTPHLVVSRDAAWVQCKDSHRTMMAIARENEGPF